MGSLDIVTVSNTTTSDWARVLCPAEYIVVGGGGMASGVQFARVNRPYTAEGDNYRGWEVLLQAPPGASNTGDRTVYAICARNAG